MAINDASFTPSALEQARGSNPAATDWVETNGGIVMPKRVHLRPGQYLYRFASSATPHARRSLGCWWLEYEVVAKIARFAREQNSTPREAARYFLALPWSWSQSDRLVKALLAEKVDAFPGEGKPAIGTHQRDARTRYIPPRHIKELYQLFIPGADTPELSKRAFSDITETEIWRSPPFA